VSTLPPWWRPVGGVIAVVLLFVPGAQLLSLVYLALYLGALIVTRGGGGDSVSDFSGDGLFMRFMSGCFPYSLMLIVGLIIMIALLLS